MKCFRGALVVGGLLLSPAPLLAAEVPEKPADREIALPLRVMSFNIRVDSAADGKNAWAHRKKMVASMIRLHRPDLIGLQEALKSQVDELGDLLPGARYGQIGAGRDDGKEGGEFVPIFYNTERFELIEHGFFWLSKTPDTAGSKGWDAALPRIVTWAHFDDKHDPRPLPLYHFNTHFDHVGNTARRESAELLRNKIHATAAGNPAVLTVDLNALEAHAPYKILTGQSDSAAARPAARAYLFDARYQGSVVHHGPTTTWTGFSEPVPGMRIDYIFTYGRLATLQHAILADHWDGRYPSDHFPVLAEVVLDR